MGLGPIEHLEPRTQVTIGTFCWILLALVHYYLSVLQFHYPPPTDVLIFLLFYPFVNIL